MGEMRANRLRILTSPWTVLLGMLAGAAAGMWLKPVVPYLKPVGEIYLSFLQMCVIPIMASAVMASLGKLFKSGHARSYVVKLAGSLSAMMVITSAVCILLSIALPRLTVPDADMKSKLGSMVMDSGNLQNTDNFLGFREIDFYSEGDGGAGSAAFSDFLLKLIPKNIFTALSNGENLKIVFFFAVFGVITAFVPDIYAQPVYKAFDGIYRAFQKLIGISMYFLPMGLCALAAEQFSSFGPSMMSSMLRLIVFIYGCALIIFILSFLIIQKVTGSKPSEQFKALRDTVIIALGTRNSFAALPSGIKGLSEGLKIDSWKVNSSLPLGITLCRFGNIMIFSVASVFAFRLYGHAFSVSGLLFVVIGSIFASTAGSGAPGILARSMISMVLEPLGIPSQVIIVMLTAIDPLIDPVTTVINVYPNCAAAVVTASGKKKDPETKMSFKLLRQE